MFEPLSKETLEQRGKSTNIELVEQINEALDLLISYNHTELGKKLAKRDLVNQALNEFLPKEYKKLVREIEQQ